MPSKNTLDASISMCTPWPILPHKCTRTLLPADIGYNGSRRERFRCAIRAVFAVSMSKGRLIGWLETWLIGVRLIAQTRHGKREIWISKRYFPPKNQEQAISEQRRTFRLIAAWGGNDRAYARTESNLKRSLLKVEGKLFATRWISYNCVVALAFYD